MQIDVTDAGMTIGGVLIFAGITAVIRPNTVTALIGPSGSGKSTLLSAMSGFTRLSTGTVVYTSAEGRTTPPHPGAIAWVPQASNALSARSVIDNVAIGPLSEGVPLSEAYTLSRACLADVGLEDLEQRRVRLISGGERQRLGFARALASQKPIIFADEPSASLDETNTLQIAALLMSLRDRATIVVATHDPLLAAAAEHTIEIRGRR
jgi:ABC-type lipoprotein export system ATPase subunit